MNVLNNYTIYSLPLSRLTEIHSGLDAAFFTELIKQLPNIGKEHANYYLINNNLTINNPYNLDHINVFNNFTIQSQQKGQLLQLVKNEQKQDEQEPQTETTKT